MSPRPLPPGRGGPSRRSRHPGDHIEVARGTAARPVLALACDPDSAAVAHAGRDVHAVALALHGQSRAAARWARILDHLTGAAAARAGPADREEPLTLGV